MIPSAAIKDYLKAPRADHRAVKQFTAATVEERLRNEFPDFRPWSGLQLHQKVACYLGLRYPRFSFWLDMGAGKTLVTLELLRYWWERGHLRRALIFVTSATAFPTWERQIKQFDIELPYLALDGSSADKWQQLQSFDEGLVLLHYPGTVAQVSVRGRGALDPAAIDRLLDKVDAVVMDESTKAGHTTSLTHMLCRRLAAKVDICYALSGRPFGRDPTLLWAQQLIVDGGASLGPTLGLFRAAFFSERPNPWDRRGWVKEYTFHKRKMPALTRLAQHRSITYTAAECIELPPVRRAIEEVSLPQEAHSYYARLVENVIAAKGNYHAMKNAFVRMRQISSGFIGMREDDTQERVEIAFDVNPKLDRLMELVDAVPEGRAAVIFYDFTWTGRAVVRALNVRGLNNIWLWSGTEDPRAALASFTSGQVPLAVINNKIGAYSLDGLQIANYLFVMESAVSVIDRHQSEARLVRQGQAHKVFIYDLVVRGTLDQKILDYHKEGGDLFKELIQHPQELLLQSRQ